MQIACYTESADKIPGMLCLVNGLRDEHLTRSRITDVPLTIIRGEYLCNKSLGKFH